jgi:hypothetical protein
MGQASMDRRIAVAIPARNEAENLPACLAALGAAAAEAGARLEIVVLANNCDDGTAGRIAGLDLGDRLDVEVVEVRLPPERAHAGWARRLALDAGAEHLRDADDLLLSTDADTLVANDWLARSLAYFDRGYAAVAGLARLKPWELRKLPDAHRARLAAIRRYDHAIGYLKAARDASEPWPRHFYEGGASIAVTLWSYRAIGGAPTPSVGEDKALFDAVRRTGGKVRHPVDVRVLTSPRLVGRAAGGTSDTLALWGRLRDDDVISGVKTIAENLDLKGAEGRELTFRDLPAELERARALVRLARQSQDLAAAG